MANNSWNAKSKVQGSASSLRITPSNSPVLRPPSRSLHKPSLHQSTLSLQSVLGTTTSSPNGFSSHDESRSFALCAGSAAVLAELDHENDVSQRFFRARPSATSINPVASFYNQSTPPTTPESRSTRPRSLSNLKLSPHANLYNGSPSNDIENSTSRAWSSRERIKAVTSVSISPNGRFLAVGETGYNPRVLIFSTAKDSLPDVPLSILNEHTIGIRSLAFSANSQCLATLGDVNDGFLFVWSINLKSGTAKLHSTNKCTSFVRDMCWMGQTLITAGVRHVKVWRIPETAPGSPSKARLNTDSATSSKTAPKALSGRNCLLGPLSDNTFTCVASISDCEAVVGTEAGMLCFLDDRDGCQKLTRIMNVGCGITSLAADFDQSILWVGGRGSKIQKFSFESLRSSAAYALSSPGLSDRSPGNQRCKGPAITCIGPFSSHLVTVDAARTIQIHPIETSDDEDGSSHAQISMSGHRDAVLGIAPLKDPNTLDAEFFTWSSKGRVNFWDTQGSCKDSRTVELDQLPGSDDGMQNELKILRAARGMEIFVSGDRLGVVRVLSGQPWRCVSEARAHGAEVTDIAVESGQDSCLIATAGRDRMVQLFQRSEEGFQLIQTMDDHVGAVTQLLFINDGEKLLSSSADRTILVRERVTREVDGGTAVAYLISKVITLKSSPISMALLPDSQDTLIVSTIDRCVQKLHITSGRHIHSFRAADPDANDAVVMDSLTVAAEIPGQNPKLLIGVSSTDKSIRVYDFERDSLLAGEFGHAEGVSDVLMLENCSDSSGKPKRTLVSAGMDGIVMIWNLLVQPPQQQDLAQPNAREEEETPSKDLTASKPPLRRILSRNELAGFQRQDSLPSTPTPVCEQSPLVRKKLSRYSLAPSSRNRNATTPSPPSATTRPSPAPCMSAKKTRRSPSPVSPKSATPQKPEVAGKNNTRRSSLDLRTRAKSNGKTEFGSLGMSTEQVCRTLRAYRKKLNGSPERLQGQKDLERELNLTLRVLDSRSKKPESAETETESSGKENRKSSKSPRIRKAPSTPNLGKKSSRKVSRSRSLDADGEG